MVKLKLRAKRQAAKKTKEEKRKLMLPNFTPRERELESFVTKLRLEGAGQATTISVLDSKIKELEADRELILNANANWKVFHDSLEKKLDTSEKLKDFSITRIIELEKKLAEAESYNKETMRQLVKYSNDLGAANGDLEIANEKLKVAVEALERDNQGDCSCVHDSFKYVCPKCERKEALKKIKEVV